MSETLSTEDLERLKSRDARFAVLAHAIAIEGEMRDSTTLKSLMTALTRDADQAMEELAEVSPADGLAISAMLVKIRALVYIRSHVRNILQQGRLAEQSIRAEDQRADGE